VKGHDEEKRKKKVTFAEPIATELKATLPDDSIILMKGNTPPQPLQSGSIPLDHVFFAPNIASVADQCSVLVEAKKQEMQMVDGNPLNMDFTPTDTSKNIPEYPNVVSTVIAADTYCDILPGNAPAEPTAGKNAEDQVVEQHDTLKNMMAGLMLDQLQNLLVSSTPTTQFTTAANSEQKNSNPLKFSLTEQSNQNSQTGIVLLAPTSAENQNVLEEGVEPVLAIDTQPLVSDSVTNISPLIDSFIESISRPIMEPLLEVGTMTPLTQITRPTEKYPHNTAPPSSSKRQSIRLAKKAAANSGKDAIQVAQDLLIKKLGELSGADSPIDNTQNSSDFDLYAQHFGNPIEKSKMEAIQVLIEQGAKMQNKDDMAVASSLVA